MNETLPAPEWIDSPYVSLEFNNWTISDDAPEELKAEFYAWMNAYAELEDQGISV